MCLAPELGHGFPETLVLDTHACIQGFWRAIGGAERMQRYDFDEILRQIVATLLNSDWRDEDELRKLPDYDRLIGSHGIETAVLQQAVQELAFAVRQQLLDIGAYTAEGCPYFLDRLLGTDMVLRLLPY